MQPGDSPVIELFDETGESLCSVVEGDGEVGKSSIVLLVTGRAFGEPVVVVVNLLLEVGDVGLESFHLLSVDIISDPDGGGEPIDD